jgi:hypothetical protein
VPLRTQPTNAHFLGRLLTTLPLAVLIGAGCHVGEAPPGAGGGGGDAGGGGGGGGVAASSQGGGGEDAGGGGGGNGDGVVDSVPTAPDCIDVETAAVPDGAFHPALYDYEEASGQGCLGMCHKEGADQGKVYSVAGAVYEEATEGSDPLAGVRVFVTDGTGKSVRMTTATNGMFYTEEALTPPLMTLVSGCPDTTPMLTPAQGNCNGSAACHGNNFRVYLEPP